MDKENDHIIKLEAEVEDLKSKLIDLIFEQNYSKEKELLIFFQELYDSLDKVNANQTKEDVIENLKKYMEVFAKNNKLNLI